MSEYNSLVSLEQESYISAYKKMQKVLIALLPIYFLNVFYYGFITIINATVACALCFIIDNICYKIQKKSRQKGDISSLITGLIFVLLLPANIPLYILIIGCFVAICVAKAPFGGFGKNIFNPAAVAFCFVAISFKSQVLMYPDTFSQGGIGGIESAKMVQGISATLTINSSPNIGMFDVVLGRFAGPLAVTSVILLLACGLFLIITKTINWKIPFITILTCSAFAFIFPRASVSQFQSVFYELTSGLIVFGSIFMATDPVLVPKKSTSQILYAFVLGITTMLFRYFGLYDLGFCFALIIVNSIISTIDISADNLVILIDKAEHQTKGIKEKFLKKENKQKFNDNFYITNPVENSSDFTSSKIMFDIEKDIYNQPIENSFKQEDDYNDK